MRSSARRKSSSGGSRIAILVVVLFVVAAATWLVLRHMQTPSLGQNITISYATMSGNTLATFPARLAGAFLRRFYWRYLIQDFGIVSIATLLGLPLMAFGTLFGAKHWMESIRSAVPATAGTVFVAALPIILGAQLLLVALVLDVLASPTIKVDQSNEVPPRD